jgi:hypothetical protein
MTYLLNENEVKSAEEFKQKFKGLKYDIGKAETFSYIFTPGPIGNKVEIRFNPGGHIMDITDYNTW